MNQPVNSADIHKAIVQEQAAQDRKKMMLNGVLLLLLLAAPFMIYPVFLMKILCFALFAVAFNLLFGFTGLLSFGHAAFLATGGYTTGYLLSNYSGLSTEMGIIAGTLAATVLGTGFALLSIRRQGIYFAMITLALAQIVYFFARIALKRETHRGGQREEGRKTNHQNEFHAHVLLAHARQRTRCCLMAWRSLLGSPWLTTPRG